ncbi:DNA (cytosine-5-)-methyltransferase [Chromatium okenii]|uniref:DNA (cytosine-5-)-methyltransferase n=1 Tax=Chromatium okenii TaxID=61644 RepID=UPI0026EF546D|nr:DNA (cytosine-5-)-methyltransferase [Chromatium okenii]MBV5309806.1 DNA (cytosine-5-)-methyltransferase [Chromatium okenii]
MIRFVDLFAGIGGMRKGFELALTKHNIKSRCVLSSEIDQNSQETYSLNFNETPNGDIRLIEALPEHDVLLAGFPCQAFSYAGKQKGFADTRGTLFFEIERLIAASEHKPKLILLENVRGFTTHDNGRTYATVISKLESLGYGIKSLLLNSSNFNVPQNRIRIYLICSLGGEPILSIESDLGATDSHAFKRKSFQSDLFSTPKKCKCVKDILEPTVEAKYHCSETFCNQLSNVLNDQSYDKLHGVRLIDHRGGNSLHSWDLGIKGECTDDERALMQAIISNRRKKHFGMAQDGKELTHDQISTFWNQLNLGVLLSSLVAKGYLRLINGKYNPTCGNMSFEVFKFLDPESVSITIVTSDAHRLGIVQNGIPRRITPRECARLQGFPDDFILHPIDSWAYRQLGNSVSVPVITAIIENLIDNTHQLFAATPRICS